MPLPPQSDLEIGYVETIKIPVGMSCQTVAIGWILKKLADRQRAQFLRSNRRQAIWHRVLRKTVSDHKDRPAAARQCQEKRAVQISPAGDIQYFRFDMACY